MSPMQQNAFSYDDLIRCAKGEMFGPGNPQLPLPPMLMCDRIAPLSRILVDRMRRVRSRQNSTSSRTFSFLPF